MVHFYVCQKSRMTKKRPFFSASGRTLILALQPGICLCGQLPLTVSVNTTYTSIPNWEEIYILKMHYFVRVYDLGKRRTAWEAASDEYEAVLLLEGIEPNKLYRVTAVGVPVVLFQRDDVRVCHVQVEIKRVARM